MTETLGEHLCKPGNPVLPDVQAADPHITLLGDRYYIYATGAGKTEPGFALWPSWPTLPPSRSRRFVKVCTTSSPEPWYRLRDT